MVYRFSFQVKQSLNAWCELKSQVNKSQELHRAGGLTTAFSALTLQGEEGWRVCSQPPSASPIPSGHSVLTHQSLSFPWWKEPRRPWTAILKKQPNTSPSHQVGGSGQGTPELGLRPCLTLSDRSDRFVTSGSRPQRPRKLSEWEFSWWQRVLLQKVRRVFNLRAGSWD